MGLRTTCARFNAAGFDSYTIGAAIQGAQRLHHTLDLSLHVLSNVADALHLYCQQPSSLLPTQPNE